MKIREIFRAKDKPSLTRNETPKELTDQKNIDAGGISVEKFINENSANLTPREMKALLFLRNIPNWKSKLEEINQQKIDMVKRFAKDPKSVFPSASYNEKTEEFSAKGSITNTR